MCKRSIEWSCFVILGALAGCGHSSIENHEAKVAAIIDTRIPAEMKRDEFLAVFPGAQLINEQNARASYLVYEQNPYLVYTCGRAFQRSVDILARVVIFDGNHISAIIPALVQEQ